MTSSLPCQPQRGLVLSGGGGNGAYQVGALRRLAESDTYGSGFGVVSGTSVGAVNAAGLARFPAAEFPAATADLERLWRTDITSTKSIWTWRLPLPVLRYLPGAFRLSLGKTKGLRRLLERRLDPKAVRESGVLLRMPAVDLHTGELAVFDQAGVDLLATAAPSAELPAGLGADRSPSGAAIDRRATRDRVPLVDAVMASSSFPVVFPPVAIGGRTYSDGGIRDLAPLSHALDAGADELVVILTTPARLTVPRKLKNSLDVLLASVETMNAEVLDNDIAICRLVNEDIVTGCAPERRRKVDPLVTIRPEEPLGDSLDFSPERLARLIDRGYRDADRELSAI